VSAFIEKYRERFGVEPICSTLGVSASAYYERASGRCSQRRIEDERLLARIVDCTRPTTAPTATGGPARRCSGPVRALGVIGCGV